MLNALGSHIDARQRRPVLEVVDEIANAICIAFRSVHVNPAIRFVDLQDLTEQNR